jgi:hypothetical protein
MVNTVANLLSAAATGPTLSAWYDRPQGWLLRPRRAGVRRIGGISRVTHANPPRATHRSSP